MGTVQLTRDATTVVTEEINCNNEAEIFIDCLDGSIDIRRTSQVAGLTCSTFPGFQNVIIISVIYSIDCREGGLRMVDGSRYNEGRVEVCSNGRWGTVCGDGWTEREAALVCSRLGYPTLSKRWLRYIFIFLFNT